MDGAASPRSDSALELQSPRLTRLLTLSRPPYTNLTVSLSDVGAPDGHPVVVYLGLGGVRYLTALYDDLAVLLNLRLVCVDRFGLGRSDDVPADRRAFLPWASVVEEVADQLGLARFSILAHSAGCPYAMATCVRLPDRVFGSVNLLAPWVGLEVDGGASVEHPLSRSTPRRPQARALTFGYLPPPDRPAQATSGSSTCRRALSRRRRRPSGGCRAGCSASRSRPSSCGRATPRARAGRPTCSPSRARATSGASPIRTSGCRSRSGTATGTRRSTRRVRPSSAPRFAHPPALDG